MRTLLRRSSAVLVLCAAALGCGRNWGQFEERDGSADAQPDVDQTCGFRSGPCCSITGGGAVCQAGLVCQGSACAPCASGLTACNNNCVDTLTSMTNCGMCGRACGAMQTCMTGSCACSGGLSACGANCVNTNTDNDNCGMCGRACTGGRTCQMGNCVR